jgi:hypothetical protein
MHLFYWSSVLHDTAWYLFFDLNSGWNSQFISRFLLITSAHEYLCPRHVNITKEQKCISPIPHTIAPGTQSYPLLLAPPILDIKVVHFYWPYQTWIMFYPISYHWHRQTWKIFYSISFHCIPISGILLNQSKFCDTQSTQLK